MADPFNPISKFTVAHRLGGADKNRDGKITTSELTAERIKWTNAADNAAVGSQVRKDNRSWAKIFGVLEQQMVKFNLSSIPTDTFAKRNPDGGYSPTATLNDLLGKDGNASSLSAQDMIKHFGLKMGDAYYGYFSGGSISP